jgi:phosphate transport system substrate-binding protein
MKLVYQTLVFSVALIASTTVHAENVTIQGAGATFPAPLYAKWVAQYNSTHSSVKLDYQPIGSGGGIKQITARTIQFGGSDAPMSDEQLKEASAKILHIPMVAGPVVIAYNLPDVKELKLNGAVLADIFLGTITKWNDPKVVAINAGTTLPDKDIVVAHRSDGSGTTWIFTNYLSKVSADWKAKVGNATAVKWPTGVAGKGNDGVAKSVQTTEGGIGYVELAYAEQSHIQYASQINKAGKVVRASIEGVVAAQQHITEWPEDFRVSITDSAGDDSYPICGFTYLLVYQDLSYLKSKDQATELMNYVNWCVHDGQEMAPELKYARLPAEVQKKVEAELKTVVVDGSAIVK